MMTLVVCVPACLSVCPYKTLGDFTLSGVLQQAATARAE